MAEVLGIASGVAGLMSLTIEVFQISYDYIDKVHNASNTIRRFLRELQDLKIVLIKVEQMTKSTDDREIFGDDHSCLFSIGESNEYLDLLGTIRHKLDKRRLDGSFRQKLKALTWPFSEDKTLGLIQELHRHLEIYQTALALDSLSVGKLTLSEVRHSKAAQRGTQVEAVLDWLSPLDMYQRQQDTLSRRHGNTGSWLLGVPIFQKWLNSGNSDRTLWCPGDPGTGKTVMTSIVVDHLIKTIVSDDVRVAYVYCDYKDQAMQTASNLIACLARQLIGTPSKLPPQLERLHKEFEPQRRRPDLEELKMLLVTLCNERERTYIVVDALDECDAIHERRAFLPLLESLPYGSTRLFVTSRPNHEDIYHVFDTASQIRITAPETEIKRFVTEKMEERKEFIGRVTPELKNQIISTICAQASGMFLLAALQIDRICVSRTVKKIKTALNSMSRELDDLYRETLERIRKQPGEDGLLGMRVLSWITHTRRPLSVEELRHGLAVEYDDDEEPDGEFDPENLLSPTSLVDVCAGLVVIDPRSQVIRLVHYTTQEFFNKERMHLFEDAENDISMACLTYLSYNAFTGFLNVRPISETLRLYPFLAYAALNWVFHISSIEPSAVAWSKAMLYVNDLERMLFSSMILRKLLLRSRSSHSRLTENDIRVRDRVTPLPLECASECGQHLLVKFILNNAKGSEVGLDSSLHCASAEGHALVVETLIGFGAKAASLSSDSSSALVKACKGGHLEAAMLLVENGANTNTPDRWMWTPLHYAAHGSHSALAAFLIERGSSPNAQTPLGMTPCHLAASRGDMETVKTLINSDFDMKLTTRDKRTALHSAAEAGHLGVISLLLASGSDALAKDKHGRYAQDLVRYGDSVPMQYGELALQYGTSMELKGIFSAYMKPLLGNQNDVQGTDEIVDNPSQPSQTEPEESVVPEPKTDGNSPKHLPDIDHLAIRSWELFMNSSEEEAGAHVWDAPRLRLVEPTPPGSPTGSNTNEQAAEVDLKEVQEAGTAEAL